MAVPCFAADAMLGRLARWLRVLGYDTCHDPAIDDPALVEQARREQRILLTRDRHLLRELRPQAALEIRSDVPLEQLQFVVAALQLTGPPGLFTRCLLDNAPLPPPLPSEEARRLLPGPGFQVPGPVRRCPRCGRLYWDGSHARRMRQALEHALPAWMAAGRLS